MSAPERIWINACGDYWLPSTRVTKTVEYIRADKVSEMIRQAVQAEREACAKVCDGWGDENNTAQAIAYAVRARGDA